MRQILRRRGDCRCCPHSWFQRWGSIGGRGNFEGRRSGGVRAASSWGLRSHGPNVSDGSVSEPAGAPAPPERKFFATSSETSESRVERGRGCNSEPQRLREAEKRSGGDRGVEERLQRQRGRGSSLAVRGPRCPLSEAKGRVSRRPPQSRSYRRPGALCRPGDGPLRYAPEAAGSLASAPPARVRSRCLSQPGREATRTWAPRSRPDGTSAVSRRQAQLSAISSGEALREARRLQQRFPNPDRTVPGLAARLPSRAGQPLGAGRRRRGPACSLERPDGNTL